MLRQMQQWAPESQGAMAPSDATVTEPWLSPGCPASLNLVESHWIWCDAVAAPQRVSPTGEE
jgi:hypothetical protein